MPFDLIFDALNPFFLLFWGYLQLLTPSVRGFLADGWRLNYLGLIDLLAAL